jgi:hypothetical protein
MAAPPLVSLFFAGILLDISRGLPAPVRVAAAAGRRTPTSTTGVAAGACGSWCNSAHSGHTSPT